MRSTRAVFEDHLAKRLAGDVEADIAANYSSEVILLTGTLAYHGHEGVRSSASELQGYVADASFIYNHTLVEESYAFLVWTAEAGGKKVGGGADSFVIKDGLIVFQSIYYSTY